MLKWTEEEEQYMLDLVKEYEVANENSFGFIYVPYKDPNAKLVAKKINSVYDNDRTHHSVRKRVQKLKIRADVFFGRIQQSEDSKLKQQILSEIYGVVDYETFIKIQSL